MSLQKLFLMMKRMLKLLSLGLKKTKAESKSAYSKAFIAKIKKAEEYIKNGETTTLNPDDIWGSLGLK